VSISCFHTEKLNSELRLRENHTRTTIEECCRISSWLGISHDTGGNGPAAKTESRERTNQLACFGDKRLDALTRKFALLDNCRDQGDGGDREFFSEKIHNRRGFVNNAENDIGNQFASLTGSQNFKVLQRVFSVPPIKVGSASRSSNYACFLDGTIQP